LTTESLYNDSKIVNRSEPDFSGHRSSQKLIYGLGIWCHKRIDSPKIGCVLSKESDAMSTQWLLTFDAISQENPGNKTWQVGVPEWLYRKHQTNGHEKALARLLLVETVLQGGTVHLFEGWWRKGKDEGCYVYAGSPGRDFKSLKIETPAPRNMLFLIFVLFGGTIDDWAWRPRSEEKGKEHLPSDIKGRLVWSLNQN
jgi:hypothetical protein